MALTYEGRERRQGLLEDVLAQLVDVLAADGLPVWVHRLRGHLGGARHVGDDPDDVGRRLQDYVVGGRAVDLL